MHEHRLVFSTGDLSLLVTFVQALDSEHPGMSEDQTVCLTIQLPTISPYFEELLNSTFEKMLHLFDENKKRSTILSLCN